MPEDSENKESKTLVEQIVLSIESSLFAWGIPGSFTAIAIDRVINQQWLEAGVFFVVSVVTLLLLRMGRKLTPLLDKALHTAVANVERQLVERVLKAIKRKNGEESLKQAVIVKILLEEQDKKNRLMFVILVLFIVLYYISSLFLSLRIWVIVPVFFLACALYARNYLLRFRVLKGYYGNNYHEAKEIVDFIENQVEKWNKPGGGSGRTVFSDEPNSVEEPDLGLEGETA